MKKPKEHQMSNDIVKFDPKVHFLTVIENLGACFREYPQMWGALNGAFPGNLADDARSRKAKSFIANTEIAIRTSKNPAKILGCLSETIVDSMVQCARCGLSLSPQAGEAYLIPYKTTCTLMIGYRGYINLLYACGMKKIDVQLVYDGDTIEITKGTSPEVIHKESLTTKRTAETVIGGYMIVVLPSGEKTVFSMDRDYMNRIKGCAKDTGIWGKWPEAMMKKGIVRNAQNYLPKLAEAPELKQYYDAIAIDEQHDEKVLAIDAKISEDQADTAAAVESELESDTAPEQSELSKKVSELRDAMQKMLGYNKAAANNYLTKLATETLGKGSIETDDELELVRSAHYGEES
jgi:recombination protein RecT